MIYQINQTMSVPFIISLLKSLDSFYTFNDDMLPTDIKKEEILNLSSFLSPNLILIHGSFVTKIRYSPNSESDLDLIIASFKKSFWNYNYLNETIRNRFYSLSNAIKFDISLISPYEVYNHIYERTSLGISILQGVSILYPEGL